MNHRTQLVETLVRQGAIRSPWVREAIETVPREVFVPRYYSWVNNQSALVDGTDPRQREDWMSGVYADRALTVHLTSAPDIADTAGAPTSSSSMPTVMAEMLEALDLQPDHRVLEIGTGTGYNAALLCHRVGESNVVSIELHPDLADNARSALEQLGLNPTVVAGDGAAVHDLGKPFDRIIATASVDHVPPAWIRQLTPDGVIVADLRGSLDGGLIRLIKTGDDIVSGKFLDIPGSFMPMRTRLDSPHRDGENWDTPLNKMNPHQGLTTTDPHAIASIRSLRFITQMHLAGHRLRGFLLDRDDQELSGHATDGSWFTVGLNPNTDAQYPVAQGGPHRLWDTVEHASAAWQHLGRPDPARFGVTAHDHIALQYVWTDSPDAATQWPLPL